jgi:hypothetical protein
MSPLFSSGTHLLHADFPDGLSHVYTAGDVMQGSVNLTLESQKQGQLKIDSVVAKLRVVQVSTYYRHRSNNHHTGKYLESVEIREGKKRRAHQLTLSLIARFTSSDRRTETVNLVSCESSYLHLPS